MCGGVRCLVFSIRNSLEGTNFSSSCPSSPSCRWIAKGHQLQFLQRFIQRDLLNHPTSRAHGKMMKNPVEFGPTNLSQTQCIINIMNLSVTKKPAHNCPQHSTALREMETKKKCLRSVRKSWNPLSSNSSTSVSWAFHFSIRLSHTSHVFSTPPKKWIKSTNHRYKHPLV